MMMNLGFFRRDGEEKGGEYRFGKWRLRKGEKRMEASLIYQMDVYDSRIGPRLEFKRLLTIDKRGPID